MQSSAELRDRFFFGETVSDFPEDDSINLKDIPTVPLVTNDNQTEVITLESDVDGNSMETMATAMPSNGGDVTVNASGLNETFTPDTTPEPLSVSDISASSTDSVLVLTPKSDVITRPDLALFDPELKSPKPRRRRSRSNSDLNLDSTGNPDREKLQNIFSASSVNTVLEQKKRSREDFDGYLVRPSDSSRLNFGLIDVRVKSRSTSDWPNFFKYIPIDARKPSLVPPCPHNKEASSHWEWWDLQTLLTEQTFTNPGVLATSSETSVNNRKKKSRKGKKLKRLFLCTTAQDSPIRTPGPGGLHHPRPGTHSSQGLSSNKRLDLVSGENINTTEATGKDSTRTGSKTGSSSSGGSGFPLNGISTHAHSTGSRSSSAGTGSCGSDFSCGSLPPLTSGRFGDSRNAEYIRVSCDPDASLTATLYTPLPAEPNEKLCHLKTDLAVTAMITYFHPWSEIQCIWVPSLKSKMADLLHEGQALRPKFARSVRMCEYRALLVVSEEAGCLIRHRELCFLRSLTSVLGIDVKHLLILVREGNLCPNTTVKE